MIGNVVSGLIGAIAAGLIGFFANHYLQQKARKDREKQLAFVYLGPVTAIVAIDIKIKSFMETLDSYELKKKIFPEGDGFDFSHACAVIVHDALFSPNKKDEATMIFYDIGRALKPVLVRAKESRITDEQKAGLPKNAIVACNRYQKTLDQIIQSLDLIFSTDERGENSKLITPNILHDTYTEVLRFFERAEVFRRTLIIYGACSPKKAANLLQEEVAIIGEISHHSYTLKEKIDKAVKSFEEHKKEKESNA